MNTIHIASGANGEDLGLPPQLFAGDTPPVSTQDFAFNLGAAIGQYVPLTRSGATFVAWTAGNAVDAISAYEIAAGARRAAVYTEGMFNIDAINWPAGTTEAVAMADMTADIKYRRLLHSDKRTGDESDYVGPGNEGGAGDPLVFTGGDLPDGTELAAYSYDLNLLASGGDGARTWALSGGALPGGATLNTATGVISGPLNDAIAGDFAPEFTVTDESGNTATAVCNITVIAN